jgi:hypothetical protein
MNVLRCIGLSIVVLLGACDAQQETAPKPKVAAGESAQVKTPEAPPAAGVQPAAKDAETAKPPVHELTPNVSVVPVVAKGGSATSRPENSATKPSGATKSAATSASNQKPGATGKRDAASRKAVNESKKTLKDTSLGNAKLDLSLPPELAEELKPAGTSKAKPRKPVLPPMFSDKNESGDRGPFELNGRILSNEMQLQMRNDNRRDVEGAALDFKFRQ